MENSTYIDNVRQFRSTSTKVHWVYCPVTYIHVKVTTVSHACTSTYARHKCIAARHEVQDDVHCVCCMHDGFKTHVVLMWPTLSARYKVCLSDKYWVIDWLSLSLCICWSSYEVNFQPIWGAGVSICACIDWLQHHNVARSSCKMAVRLSDASDDESVVAEGGTFDEDDADMVLSSHPVPLNLPLLTHQQGAFFCY